MLKKMLCVVILLSFILMGCGNSLNTKNQYGGVVHYEQIGLFELCDMDPNVQYDLNTGNLIWSVLLSPLGIPSFIIMGWYLYEPIFVKKGL